MYKEEDLYDGMMLIWVKRGVPYSDSNVYKWDAVKETVSSKRGQNTLCKGYSAIKILENMNAGHCYPEILESLIFN